MHKKLSTTAFVVSMSLILLVSLVYILGLYFILNPQSPESVNLDKGPVTKKPVSLTLNLSSPDDNSLVFEPDLLIQGKTIPGATVILSSTDDDVVIETTSKGDFSTTIKLQSGVNKFTLAAFDTSGNSKNETRTIYYSTEKI